MDENDDSWDDFWSEEACSGMDDFKIIKIGADKYPTANYFMASFFEPIRHLFKDGISVLDYGCGQGRFANFMMKRLDRFSYYGFEREGSAWSSDLMSSTLHNFDLINDKRVRFAYIGGGLEEEAMAKCDAAIMASVFTHLRFESFLGIMDKFDGFIRDGNPLVFSVFVKEKYRVSRTIEKYGFEDCYSRVVYSWDQLEEFSKDNPHLGVVHCGKVVVKPWSVHEIFRVDAA